MGARLRTRGHWAKVTEGCTAGPYMLGQGVWSFPLGRGDDPVTAEIGLWELTEEGDTGVVANNRTAGRLGNWPAGVQLCM